MLCHFDVGSLASSSALLTAMNPLVRTQMSTLIIVVATSSKRLTHLAWRSSIDHLATATKKDLLRRADHPRILIVRALSTTRLQILLLQHLLVLHLLHLLQLLLLLGHELLMLRPSRLHGRLLRAWHS